MAFCLSEVKANGGPGVRSSVPLMPAELFKRILELAAPWSGRQKWCPCAQCRRITCDECILASGPTDTAPICSSCNGFDIGEPWDGDFDDHDFSDAFDDHDFSEDEYGEADEEYDELEGADDFEVDQHDFEVDQHEESLGGDLDVGGRELEELHANHLRSRQDTLRDANAAQPSTEPAAASSQSLPSSFGFKEGQKNEGR